MARPAGEPIRSIFQQVLKQYCEESCKHGQQDPADELGITRKTLNRALNGHPVDTAIAVEVEAYARSVMTRDPEIIERGAVERKREPLLPQMRIAKIIEDSTHFPPATCSRIAHKVWSGIVETL